MMKLVVCLVLGEISATTTNGRVDLRRLDSEDVDLGLSLISLRAPVVQRPESLLNPYTMEGSDPQNNHLRHDHY